MEKRVKEYFRDPRKIKAVKALDNFTLLITFDNGELKKYDMSNDLTGVFSVLKDKRKFDQVFINQVGNVAWKIDDNIDSSKHWENEIDICKDALYMDSVLAQWNNAKGYKKLQEIIEQYPDDFPFPSCLIYGTDKAGKLSRLFFVLRCNI